MIHIECLFAPDCGARDHTLALVHAVTEELGITAQIRETTITHPAAAQAQRFLGSPTIRVNGRDIEPEAAKRDDFGLG